MCGNFTSNEKEHRVQIMNYRRDEETNGQTICLCQQRQSSNSRTFRTAKNSRRDSRRNSTRQNWRRDESITDGWTHPLIESRLCETTNGRKDNTFVRDENTTPKKELRTKRKQIKTRGKAEIASLLLVLVFWGLHICAVRFSFSTLYGSRLSFLRLPLLLHFLLLLSLLLSLLPLFLHSTSCTHLIAFPLI